jgi:hypothetical protein
MHGSKHEFFLTAGVIILTPGLDVKLLTRIICGHFSVEIILKNRSSKYLCPSGVSRHILYHMCPEVKEILRCRFSTC